LSGTWGSYEVTDQQRLAVLAGYGIDILAVHDKVAEDLAKQETLEEAQA
jgi:hypothetical protein